MIKPKTILQIIPAGDWFAEFKADDGTKFYVPLVCWALVANGVLGMTAGDYVEFCDELSNFSGYVHKNDTKREVL